MSRKLAFRSAIMALFILGCLSFGVVFYLSSGGHVRGVNIGSYRLSMESNDVDGLVNDGEVRIAGVVVGRVTQLKPRGPDGKAQIGLTLNDDVAPLHQGLTARIGMKSLVGASYVDLVDGKGPELASGSRIPDSSILPSTEVQDVIRRLDPKARDALGDSVRSLGTATQGRGQNIGQLVGGLGNLGRQGHTALDAIAAQNQDLQALTRETAQLTDTLDEGQGQIVDVSDQASKIAHATATQRPALEQTVQKLPGVLNSARTATSDLRDLSGALAPVASNLNRAAPDLNSALVQLPGVSQGVRGLLPPLNEALGRAPATLDKLPPVASDIRGLIPPTRGLLRDANPVLAYAAPYGRDVGAMTANFGSALQTNVENGVNAVRLAPVLNDQSVRNLPLNTAGLNPMNWNNPYPPAGGAANTPPFSGQYPRVERAPG